MMYHTEIALVRFRKSGEKMGGRVMGVVLGKVG